MPQPNFFPPFGTQSFLSPDFTTIDFPSGTPAVPPHPQPQYPSSDIGSSTPSTPESTRSTSSASSSSKDRPKTREYSQDPKYPDNALHWHSKHNGKCPQCDQSGGLTKPQWHSKKKRLFIRCKSVTCNYWRFTDYYTDPPSSTSSTSTPAVAVPPGITFPCSAQPCSTGNKRNCNVACTNSMCLQDCVKTGPSNCSVHRKAKRDYLSGAKSGRPPSVLFQGPSLSSMPSIPSSSMPSIPPSSLPSIPPSSMQSLPLPTPGSFLDAARPPSSPNPTNPRSLHDITTSTVKPSLQNPLPLPTASPLQEGPTFLEVRRYARELPGDWAAVISAQQSAKAQQMLYEAQFRSHIKEGISVTVVFWRARLGVAPYLFERVVHAGIEYSLSEDVDLCTEVGFDPKTVFILAYIGGMWCHRSPRERHRVKPGSFLFFREAGPVAAYEDPLLRFDELLTLATDAAFGEASNFLTSGPTTTPPPTTGPRPRPRPRLRPLGLPQTDHRYNWITARSAASIASTESSTPSPSVTSTASASTASSSAASSSAASSSTTSSSANSSLSRGSNNSGESDDSGPKRSWPDEYTVREIHEGLLAMVNKGRARKGSGIKIWHRFQEAFPDAERWIIGRYYSVMETWKSYAIDGDRAQKDALKAWLETDATWTSIFALDDGPSAAKKRKVQVFEFDDSD